ncbi:unnamed protein product [Nesidiocoris tenuis]|uniref:Uncharacterized protein n=1 Tax=Nesidiocoris tenuis TaxID=355587 RepID=A0A6H5HJ40_9HEMI|nr:unnamed protein product [Nesidiocoris tenuis]
MGALCVTEGYRLLPTPVIPARFDTAKQKAELASNLLVELGLIARHNGQAHSQLHNVVDAVAHSLLITEPSLLASRVIALNATTGLVISAAVWRRESGQMGMEWRQPAEVRPDVELPQELPWIPKQIGTLNCLTPNVNWVFIKLMIRCCRGSEIGGWTYPYYSCIARTWVLSFSIDIPVNKHGIAHHYRRELHVKTRRGSKPDVSQTVAHCHFSSQERSRWSRGNYICLCRPGFYMDQPQVPFLGNIVEAAWLERNANGSQAYDHQFMCQPCAEGCETCVGPEPCLSQYNWPCSSTATHIPKSQCFKYDSSVTLNSAFFLEIFQEEIQKLAGQIEFMRIVSMEMNNRHVKPRPGGYFSVGTAVLLQSPRTPRDTPQKDQENV